MSIPAAKSAAEDLLELAQDADAAITAFRALLSNIYEKECAIVRELQAGGGHPAWAGPGIRAGQSGLALYAASRARLPQSTPNPNLADPTVLQLASSAWAFLNPNPPS